MNEDDVTRDELDMRLDATDDTSILPLANDNDTPFSDPDDPVGDMAMSGDAKLSDGIDDTHQATDSASNIDSQQRYDEGLSGAAEASEPNANSAVLGYDPSHDQRKQ